MALSFLFVSYYNFLKEKIEINQMYNIKNFFILNTSIFYIVSIIL